MITEKMIVNGITFKEWQNLSEILDNANNGQLRQILIKVVDKLPEKIMILSKQI